MTRPQDISWVDRARRILNTGSMLGGTVAEAITAPTIQDTRFAAGSGWTISASLQAATGATGTCTFVDDNQANAWDLVILKQGGAVAVPYTIDGTGGSIDTSAQTNNTVVTYRITAGAGGAHTLVFSGSAAGSYQILKLTMFTAWPSRGYAASSPGDLEQVLWHQALYEVADTYNVPVFDLHRRWGYGYDPGPLRRRQRLAAVRRHPPHPCRILRPRHGSGEGAHPPELVLD